uniref:Gamma-secretase subunit Aph-1 n=1 Tax=Graphocephala atropunctata TaxID=36148 RepID=A0A1B6MP23_9HEMI
MTWMEFVGCAGVAYGPPLALFVFTIMSDPIRIIILIASAFFWLVALLLSSFVWFVFPFKSILIFGIICSVLFQELFRYLIYVLLRKAEAGLKKVTIPNTNTEITNNKHILAYVAGLGFGIMSGAFSLINILADLVGPATMGLKGGSSSFCLISAILSMCFILLHTFWGVIFFAAIDKKNYFHISWVIVSHISVSCLSLLTQSMFYFPIISALVLMLFSGYIAFVVSGGSCNNCKRVCRCGNQRTLNLEPSTSST